MQDANEGGEGEGRVADGKNLVQLLHSFRYIVYSTNSDLSSITGHRAKVSVVKRICVSYEFFSRGSEKELV